MTRAILQIPADYAVSNAEDLLLATAKAWIAGKTWIAKTGWNQAVNARFAQHCIDESFGDLEPQEKAVWLLNLSNASAMRQWLEDKKAIAKTTDALDDFK